MNVQSSKDFFCDSIRLCERDMYAVAFSILKNQSDAEDAVQESVLKAYSSLDTLRDREKFRPWVLRIAHHTAVSFLRGSVREEDLEDREELGCPDFSTDTDTRITVWDCVQRLKLPYRQVVILYYYQGCPVEEIAQIMGRTAPAIRQQLARSRKLLAGMMKKEDLL